MQKARQTVVVSVRGARSNATLGIVGLNVHIVYIVLYIFPLLLLGGGGRMFYVDLYLNFKYRFNYFI